HCRRQRLSGRRMIELRVNGMPKRRCGLSVALRREMNLTDVHVSRRVVWIDDRRNQELDQRFVVAVDRSQRSSQLVMRGGIVRRLIDPMPARVDSGGAIEL